MSDSALAVYTAISPNCNRPRSQPISKITVHHMAGDMTLESFGALVGRPSRQMSANYAIESSGRIGLFCHEADRSWCSSSPWNDQRAITIEVANDSGAPDWHVSDKAYAALLDLCTDICRRNGIKELTYTGDKNGSLTMHCFYAATACPGPYLKSKFPDIAAQVTKRLKGDVADAAPAKTQEQTFIDVMAEKCQSRCLAAHLLPSLCIAQACLESAYGTSELAVQANNLFGIKASNWSGRVYNKATKEWDGSKYITITADFRKYDCVEKSIADHSAYLLGAKNGSKLRYDGLKDCTDYKKAVQIIKDGGYATSSTYVSNLCSIIEKWKLTQFDVGAGTPAPDNTVKKFPATPFTVRVIIDNLNYRSEPSMNGRVNGQTGIGTFTIMEVKNGWGRLKSGAGWIYLENPEYCTIGNAVAAAKPVTKTVDELAKEVIKGLWGNGTERKNKLTAAGYDYTKIQNKVNEFLK